MRRYATPFDVAIRLALIIGLYQLYPHADALLPGGEPLLIGTTAWLLLTLAARTANPEPRECDCPCRRSPEADDADDPFGYHP